MKIAFLGWGSLIWDQRGLQITGSWKNDGPSLPIEFARVSKGGRLTLVLYSDASPVSTLWAHALRTDLQQAIENLAKREDTCKNNIGFVSIQSNNYRCNVIPHILPSIKSWAKHKGLDVVVWTDLPSNFKEKTNLEFSEDNVMKYLREFKGQALRNAEEYIRKAPEQIETPIRKKLRQKFGWENIPI